MTFGYRTSRAGRGATRRQQRGDRHSANGAACEVAGRLLAAADVVIAALRQAGVRFRWEGEVDVRLGPG